MILILEGTGEARELAAALVERRKRVTISLARRVANPRLTTRAVRIGGFGGPDALARWLADHEVRRLAPPAGPAVTSVAGAPEWAHAGYRLGV